MRLAQGFPQLLLRRPRLASLLNIALRASHPVNLQCLFIARHACRGSSHWIYLDARPQVKVTRNASSMRALLSHWTCLGAQYEQLLPFQDLRNLHGCMDEAPCHFAHLVVRTGGLHGGGVHGGVHAGTLAWLSSCFTTSFQRAGPSHMPRPAPEGSWAHSVGVSVLMFDLHSPTCSSGEWCFTWCTCRKLESRSNILPRRCFTGCDTCRGFCADS